MTSSFHCFGRKRLIDGNNVALYKEEEKCEIKQKTDNKKLLKIKKEGNMKPKKEKHTKEQQSPGQRSSMLIQHSPSP